MVECGISSIYPTEKNTFSNDGEVNLAKAKSQLLMIMHSTWCEKLPFKPYIGRFMVIKNGNLVWDIHWQYLLPFLYFRDYLLHNNVLVFALLLLRLVVTPVAFWNINSVLRT